MLTLYAHQKTGRDRLIERERYYLAWGMGSGKTITTLSAIDADPLKTLVVCPLSVMRAAWLNDGRHFPGIIMQTIRASSKAKRLAQINGEWDVAVINHDLLRLHWQDFANVGVRRLVIDEASKCKNYKAAVTAAATKLADRCASVWLLSGTPAPNCPSEWIPQLRILSPSVVGSSYWGAINRYFTPVKRTLRDGRQVIERYTQSDQQAASFQARLKDWCWSLRKEDCLDLPAKTDVVIDVELKDEAGIYEAASEDFVLMLKNGERSPIKRGAALIKLRQIVGGGVIVEGHQRHIGSSKLNALSDLLDELGHDQPVVIWAEFRDEIRRIEAMILDRGEMVGTIYGETSALAGETASRFQRGELKRLVCHPASAGHGLTLTAASYAVYYSLSFSMEQHEQSRDRIHRIGHRLDRVGVAESRVVAVLRRPHRASAWEPSLAADAQPVERHERHRRRAPAPP